jgi:RHS repeat-associated protein
LFRKTADGSEPSVSISYSSPAGAAAAVAVVYRGVDPVAPLEQPGVGSQGSALAVTAPSVTARDGGRLVTIAAAAHHPLPASFAAPAGMGARADASGQPSAASALYDQPLSGGSGSRTVGFGQTAVGTAQGADLLAVNLALRPRPAAFLYDQSGNRTRAVSALGASTLGWDQANRLTSFAKGSVNATYAYDGDGIRTSKTVAGLAQPMVWDRSGSLPMLLSDGDASYLYGPGGTPVEQNKPVPITAVGSSTASANSTSLTVPLPSGVLAGDQIVLAMTYAASTASSISTGYTELVPARSSHTRVFTRTATSTEAAAVITFGAQTQASASMTIYRGVDAVNPVVAHSDDVSIDIANAGSVNADDGLVVLVGGGLNGSLDPTSCSFAFPVGMTVRQTACAGATARWSTGTAMADQPIRGGPTGSKSLTYGTLTSEVAAVQIALRSRRGMEYFHQDQLGSTRALTDAGGAVVATFSYDPYGRQTASGGSATTPLGFAGQYTDAESGFQYLRARYYDPVTAQFLTRDPLEAVTRSAYGYVDGDPLNGADPAGLVSNWSIVKQAVAHPMGSFFTGWNSMTTKEKIADASLPVVLPLAAAACWIYCPAAIIAGTAGLQRAGSWVAQRCADLGGETGSIGGDGIERLGANARSTSSFDEIARRLSQFNGISADAASERLHAIKAAYGLGGADNVLFDLSGNVYDATTRELLGRLTEGGGAK